MSDARPIEYAPEPDEAGEPAVPPTSPLRTWMRRGGWALTDQALFSCANFLVQVLLAKWLHEGAYGAFVTAFTWFIFIGNFHSTLLVDPLLVFGSSKFSSVLRKYVNSLLAMSLLLSGVGVTFFTIIGCIYFLFDGQREVAISIWSIGLASPFIFTLWLVRRVCYVRLDPMPAAISGVFYLVLMASGLVLLNHTGHLTVVTAMAVMGVSSIIVAGALAYREGASCQLDPQITREAARDHWGYGRWAMNSGLLLLLPGHLFYLILPFYEGLEASGSVRAMWNLFMPFVQANAAFCGLLVPSLVRSWGTPMFGRALRVALLMIVGVPTVMCVGAGLFPKFILHAVYENKYDQYASLLWLLGLQVVLMGALSVVHAILSSQQKANQIFVACVVSAVMALALMIPTLYWFGVTGCVVLTLFTLGLNVVISVRFARDLTKKADAQAVKKNADADAPPKLLVVAFACEPGQGSELGVGWSFVHEVSQRQPVWVVCHQQFRAGIERHMPNHVGHPIHFTYLKVPGFFEWMTKRTPTLNVYYYLWNILCRGKVRKLHREVRFDVVQHVSYMRYWMPSLGARLGIPFVWGPVGGGENAPTPYLKTLALKDRLKEMARSFARRVFEFDPFLRLAAGNTTVALAATEQTAECFKRLGVRDVRTVPPVLLPEIELTQFLATPRPSSNRKMRFVCVGRMLHWKGFQYGIRAFAQARMIDSEFWLIGNGPYRPVLERLAADLGVTQRVKFLGTVSRAECIRLVSECHALVHPSLHDSGGLACLEALAMGKPILCLDVGGPGVIVDERCGVLGSPDSPSLAIDQMAEAMRDWASDDVLYARLSANATTRAKELSQSRRAMWYDSLHRQLMRHGHGGANIESEPARAGGVALATAGAEV